jgi:hypothetical protein
MPAFPQVGSVFGLEYKALGIDQIFISASFASFIFGILCIGTAVGKKKMNSVRRY